VMNIHTFTSFTSFTNFLSASSFDRFFSILIGLPQSIKMVAIKALFNNLGKLLLSY
jgi:hypothetical protein